MLKDFISQYKELEFKIPNKWNIVLYGIRLRNMNCHGPGSFGIMIVLWSMYKFSLLVLSLFP